MLSFAAIVRGLKQGSVIQGTVLHFKEKFKGDGRVSTLLLAKSMLREERLCARGAILTSGQSCRTKRTHPKLVSGSILYAAAGAISFLLSSNRVAHRAITSLFLDPLL